VKGNLIRTTLALLVTASAAKAQSISVAGLPLYNKAALQSKEDWLLAPTARKSAIYRTPEGYMALSNGLITRTFTLTPNGATIGLDNLVTNEALVRAVSPEAVLWINGHEIKAGGLTGQPIGNYLLPKWIPDMKADPLSLKLTSYTTAPIKARFEWNRRTEWSPQQLPWPPKGMEVTFTYQADATIMSGLSSDISRKVLFTDNFLSLSPKWEIIKGAASQNASFQNEGKAGEIQTAANSVLFAEQALSPETKVIICKLNSGTDESNGYGSGIALQFPDGRSSKFHLAPGTKRFRVFHDNKSANFEGYDPGKSYFLRILFLTGRMAFSISEDGKTYTTLTELPAASQPTHVRIGKTDPQGGRSERGEAGTKGRSKVEAVLILGAPEAVQQDLRFLSGLTVKVHYEIYDGIPLLSKWVSVTNNSKEQIIINNIKSEQLAVTEAESAVEHKQRWEMPPILAESDFAFGSMSSNAAQNACVDWQTDPSYTTQVNYNLKTPSVLVCMPKTGMGQEVAAGASTESARIWELIFDSYDRERRGLSQKKLYRTIAPWVTENPIIMHVSSAADEPVKSAIDQSAEVGFEMVIMTFGSGFNIEDTTQQNLQRMKQLKQYAASKGIALGGYSLLASRSINKENDVIMPEGMKPAFGNSPCLRSEWAQNYFRKLYNFYEKTGQDLLEHDGSYPGDVCASTTHPGHRDLEDSRWKQYKTIQQFYQWCRGKGIYLNIPDWYFLSGGTKVAMGYRETNWSLPREQQEIIERQNIYDGTWEKTPSMGWMFVPLVQYHGGGAAATIEPLKEHLPHYEQRLANLFGAGVQACYRGPRLYDAPETKVLVKKWVDFYKKYRRVLDGDLIHLRRPDGRDYDGILHVDPQGKDKGLIMIYNPLTEPITRNIEVDVYYTGLKDQASIIGENGIAKKVTLKGTKLNLQVTIPANSQQWFALRQQI
jgi:hypothetical protein